MKKKETSFLERKREENLIDIHNGIVTSQSSHMTNSKNQI